MIPRSRPTGKRVEIVVRARSQRGGSRKPSRCLRRGDTSLADHGISGACAVSSPSGRLDHFKRAWRPVTLDHGKAGIRGQITWYQIGIGKLGMAVGLAAYGKGYDAGWEARKEER
jgi:hypothetical protein